MSAKPNEWTEVKCACGVTSFWQSPGLKITNVRCGQCPPETKLTLVSLKDTP